MINLIPKPAKYKNRYGEFFIKKDSKIYVEKRVESVAEKFNEIVEKSCGYRLELTEKSEADIQFLLDINMDNEEYSIDCTVDKLIVKSATRVGAFYALQSIRILTNADLLTNTDSLSMQAVEIYDKPTYKWRGLLLDEARFFFGPAVIKDIIDMMGLFKLNVLHWHLTDNEGWRVEIKKYPKLTEIGSYRKGTQNLAWGKPDAIDWTPHEGYYTQEEISEIVEYARQRNVMIVPEIDVPAHFAAAVSSYKELSCRSLEIEPSVKHFDNHKIIACAGKQSTFDFIYDVIDELSELFPAPYFHIGGDEAPKDEWKICPLCQEKMKAEGLESEEELQGYLNNKIAVYLKRKNKKLICWNEALKAKNLESSIIAQYWTYLRDRRVNAHIESGGQIIVSKHQAFYFDMTYMQNNLRTTYKYTDKKYGLVGKEAGILGLEGALWTEWIMSIERLHFQMFPRLQALAEVAWTPQTSRDYKNFRFRLKKFLPTLEAMGKLYCPLSMVDRPRILKDYANNRFVKIDANFEYKESVKRKNEDNKRITREKK